MLLNVLSDFFMELTDFSGPNDEVVFAFLEDLVLVFLASLDQDLFHFFTVHHEHGEEEVVGYLHAEIQVCSDF